jgi:hypothetical protein
MGMTGMTGPAGMTGATGATGATGPAGPAGPGMHDVLYDASGARVAVWDSMMTSFLHDDGAGHRWYMTGGMAIYAVSTGSTQLYATADCSGQRYAAWYFTYPDDLVVETDSGHRNTLAQLGSLQKVTIRSQLMADDDDQLVCFPETSAAQWVLAMPAVFPPSLPTPVLDITPPLHLVQE